MWTRTIPFLLVLVIARPGLAQWHVDAYVGETHTQRTNLLLSQPSADTALIFRGVEFVGHSFTGPLYYGVRGGYFFPRHFGIDGEFMQLRLHLRSWDAVNHFARNARFGRKRLLNGYYLEVESGATHDFIADSVAKVQFRFARILDWICRAIRPL